MMKMTGPLTKRMVNQLREAMKKTLKTKKTNTQKGLTIQVMNLQKTIQVKVTGRMPILRRMGAMAQMTVSRTMTAKKILIMKEKM